MTSAFKPHAPFVESSVTPGDGLCATSGGAWQSEMVSDLINAAPEQGYRPLRELLPGLHTTIHDAQRLQTLLSTRANNCLASVGIYDWEELLNRSLDDLLAIRNMGLITVREILAIALRQLLNEAPTLRLSKRDPVPNNRSLRELFPELNVSDGARFPSELVAPRAAHCLAKAQILTWGDLLETSTEGLHALPNMGEISVDNIMEVVSHLASLGHIPDEETPATSLEQAITDLVRSREGISVTRAEIQRMWVDTSGHQLTASVLQRAVDNIVKTDSISIMKSGRSGLRFVEEDPVPKRVREMIQLRWENWTLKQIAERFSLSRERVRQLLEEYGGPRNEELAARRKARDAEERMNLLSPVRTAIREQIAAHGPMSVQEIAAHTGLDADEIMHNWPKNLKTYQLHQPFPKASQRWSDEDILKALRDAAIYSFPLTSPDYDELVRLGEVVGPSRALIIRRFGTWNAACEAADVEPHPPIRPSYESKWTDDDLLAYAREYFCDLNFTGAAQRYDEWRKQRSPDAPSVGTLRNRFGSWTELKRRALVTPEVRGA